jgi:hypothetical protein
LLSLPQFLAAGGGGAAGALPAELFFCSPSRAAYRGLGLYDNFGAALGAGSAALTPLRALAARGPAGLRALSEASKGITGMNPVGLVSGSAGFDLEDARAATQLGGAFAATADGRIVYAWRDRAVADHAPFPEILAALGL